jgi:predicted ATPase
LHPQAQAALGELMARCASDGVQIIVKTHSDHLLNGVRLSIKRKIIERLSVALHFFSRDVQVGEASVQTPAILENGRLSNWPNGFFDQWDRDVEALLDLRLTASQTSNKNPRKRFVVAQARENAA